MTIRDKDLDIWAGYLLDHSLGGISSDDLVMIKGEYVCWPLIATLEKKIIEAGGIADVFIVPPNNERGRVWSASMGHYASVKQIERTPMWTRSRYEEMTKYIEILGAEDPKLYANVDPEQLKAMAKADQPYSSIRLAKPWVLTLFPTKGFAEMEQMDHQEYIDFIVNASTTDPRPLKAAEEKIAPLIDQGKELIIETEHPSDHRKFSLTMKIDTSHAEMSYGLRNFPDGEVFTSPDARSIEGEIFVDLPVHNGGVDISGIYLRFENGKIVDYNAEQGHKQLEMIIETDEGSHRLGEVAFGMNPGLQRVLKHPLFVEKVGGTMHIAIGASYEHCFNIDQNDTQASIADLKHQGIINTSAQHVDIVIDFRQGGAGKKVSIDGKELIVRDHVWHASA